MTNNKTFRSVAKNGRVFNLLALPGTNFFKFEMINQYGSNIEKVVKSISGKNVYGISHFIEHLSFKSTKDYTTQKILMMGKNEGIYNAGTNSQSISYWFKTIAANRDLAIRFVCNVALNDLKKVTQEEFESERSVVYNEAKRAYDDPQMMFHRDSMGVLVGYESQDNTIGRPEVIETFTLQDTIDVKNALLSNQEYIYNIIYDSNLMNEEEIITQIEQELSRFSGYEQTIYKITAQQYAEHLKYPRVGEFKLENASEQAMTRITIDAIENTLVSSAAVYYLALMAENTSLDDLIRQKNGLTYGTLFYINQISYKPYASFVCDVSKGNEELLMKLFKESINASADGFDEEKYNQYMKSVKLTRAIEYLNLEAYDLLFYFNNLQASDLDPAREILATNVDKGYEYIESNIITYNGMKGAMEKIRALVNVDTFGKVSN